MRITPQVEDLIDRALAEDAAFNDATTSALIPADLQVKAHIGAKATGVLAGVEVALAVFQRVDPTLKTIALLQDGSRLSPGSRIALIRGSAASILQAERTALNFLQRMSGIATETVRYVEAVKGLKARIVDTRKTAPGLRELDKYAVRMGGGHNHRLNLADGVLVKDNHIAALRARGMALKEVVRQALEHASHTLKVEVEVTTVEEAKEAVETGAHVIMADNMSLDEIREVVKTVDGRAVVEVSGGVSLENVRAIAETGVDLVSVGALTHSPRALDISLDIDIER